MANENKVGKRIKTYRENLKMTLADLAEKSGVGAAVIASIEDGEVLPALGVLTKLSRALGQRLNPAGYAYYSLAIGKPDRHMDPFRIEFSANAPTSPSSHEGEELIIVLDGTIELTYGPETTVLHAGDTAYYNSVVTHSLRALDGKPASIYGIVFLPF